MTGRSRVCHVHAPDPECHRGQEPDGARAHDRGLARPPHPKPALDLEGLGDALLHHRGRLEQDADLPEAPGDLHQELGVIHVVLGQVAVAEVDAALVVDVVGGHVIGADDVVDAVAGPAYRGDDVVPHRQLGDVGPHRLDPAEALVPDHQEIEPFRRRPVLGGVDLLVGSVHPDSQHLHQHSTPAGDVGERRTGHRRQVYRAGFPRDHGDSLHHRTWRGVHRLRHRGQNRVGHAEACQD
jgi:hypothetical protein